MPRSTKLTGPSILLAALGLALGCSRGAPETFRTEPVSRGPITEVVSATGDVSAIVTVTVGSQVSGTIARLYVDFNSKVKKNQVLAEIDPRLFRAQLERAEASLASAKANVEKAEAALHDAQRQEKRMTELLDQKLVSQADLDTATANREGGQAQLSSNKALVLQARADRDTAAANLAYTHITSPIDGVVISRAIDVGQTVAAAFQAPTLFTIANDLTKMQILANIDEADVGKVKDGLDARFTVDAYPGDQFRGHIREVRQSPNTIQNVVTYPAVIDAPNPEHKLRPGMTAAVQITSGKRDDTLRLPNASLRFRPASAVTGPATTDAPAQGRVDRTLTSAGGQASGRAGGAPGGGAPGGGAAGGGAAGGAGPGASGVAAGERGAMRAEGDGQERRGPPARMGRVYKLDAGKPVPVQVRLGISDGQRTEVLEGLAEGDQVIVGDSNSPAGSGTGGRPQPGMRRGPF